MKFSAEFLMFNIKDKVQKINYFNAYFTNY